MELIREKNDVGKVGCEKFLFFVDFHFTFTERILGYDTA